MPGKLAQIILDRRTGKSWTQEQLAEHAKLSTRTIQRAESSGEVSLKTVHSIASALDVSDADLLSGLTVAQIEELRDLALCPTCDAPIEVKTSVDYYDMDIEVEIFECGFTRGLQSRPCPHGPDFPKLEDFDIQFQQTELGEWFYSVLPLTENARNLDLGTGAFSSREEADRHVKRSYAILAIGYDATVEKYPLY